MNAPDTKKNEHDLRVDQCINEFLQGSYAFSPGEATAIGVHDYDTVIEDRSERAIEDELTRLRGYRETLQQSLPDLSQAVSVDCRAMLARIHSQITLLGDQQVWRHDPLYYSDLVSDSVFVPLSKDFAPWMERANLIVERTRQAPDLLAAARNNLRDCPRVVTEKCLELLPGINQLYNEIIPQELNRLENIELQNKYDQARAGAVVALGEYREFLENTLQSGGDHRFALGPELYHQRLQTAEMVDIPLERLLAIGREHLAAVQDDFRATAAIVDGKGAAPGIDAKTIYAALSNDHPEPDALVGTVEKLLEDLRSYIVAQELCTIPSDDPCTVAVMPPFMWAFACIWPAGMLELTARGAEYYIAPVREDWDAQKQREHMQNFNFPALMNISAHEAWPGHFLESLWTRRAPSDARKVYWCYSFGEGWAHYSEQLMVETGFHDGDPKLKLAQLSDALLRLCRYIVSIEMHTRGMSVAEGIAFFEREGFLNHHVAEEETIRGTFDPMYCNYALGKIMVLKLREDFQRHCGPEYSLRRFHDTLLSHGSIPVPLVRELMLGPDNGSLL